jgi:hypothetical protein
MVKGQRTSGRLDSGRLDEWEGDIAVLDGEKLNGGSGEVRVYVLIC